jgi:NAD(P)-dependent dehydrogenase (short-subunit alcohol dehydrogenase family)
MYSESAVGGLDILVDDAGIPNSMGVQQLRESEPAAWRPYVDLNLHGVMNCSRPVINGMCDRGYGRIVTISSGAGTVGLNLGVSPNGAGKGGSISFMRDLALETARQGVTANTIAVGLIDNHRDRSVTPDDRAQRRERHDRGRGRTWGERAVLRRRARPKAVPQRWRAARPRPARGRRMWLTAQSAERFPVLRATTSADRKWIPW